MGQQVIQFRIVGNVTIAVLAKSGITPEVNRALHDKLTELQADNRPATFVLDLSSLQILGSVGLSALVIFLKRVRSSGGRLVLAGLRERRRRVMVATGLDNVFDLYEDVPSALKALSETDAEA